MHSDKATVTNCIAFAFTRSGINLMALRTHVKRAKYHRSGFYICIRCVYSLINKLWRKPKGKSELTIQRYGQQRAQDTERRQTKTKQKIEN